VKFASLFANGRESRQSIATETHLVGKSSIERFAADEGKVSSVIHRLFLPGLFGNADTNSSGFFSRSVRQDPAIQP
jgi:hypothetical protein